MPPRGWPKMYHHPDRPAVWALALVLAGILVLNLAPAPAVAESRVVPAAILQGLDKTTARVSTIVAPIGAVTRFGSLEIVARACHKKPPTETPESTAFLEIVDVRPDSPAVRIFTGWMFASSPALSALEHPVYDVWVIDCGSGEAPTKAPGPEAAEKVGSPAPDKPSN